MDTKTTYTPATPIPVGQRAEIITCLCFVNTLAIPGGTIAQQRCTGRGYRGGLLMAESHRDQGEGEGFPPRCPDLQLCGSAMRLTPSLISSGLLKRSQLRLSSSCHDVHASQP